MIKLKDLILEGRLKSVTVITADVMKRIVDVAQKQYNQWAQNEEGYDEELGSGGICHLIAEEVADILSEHGINASTVSSNFEQHVYVVAQFREGIYEIDIPYQYYETGGGFTWKKLPDIVFDTSHIVLHKLDSNPRNFKKYIDLYD